MQFIAKAKEVAKNALVRAVSVATVAASPLLAHAQSSGTSTGPDFSSLTSSIDLGTVITAVMAVAAAMVGVYIAIKGAKIVLRMVRGA